MNETSRSIGVTVALNQTHTVVTDDKADSPVMRGDSRGCYWLTESLSSQPVSSKRIGASHSTSCPAERGSGFFSPSFTLTLLFYLSNL